MATLKNTTVAGTGAITLPVGTTAQRPGTPQAGDMRFNDDFNTVEYYDGSAWRYQPDIVRNGLVLHLDAGEPDSVSTVVSSGQWTDLSAGSRDASITGSVSVTENAVDFDGGYASVNASGVDFSTQQTIFMILTPEESDANRRNPYNQAYGGYGTITHEPNGGFNYYHGTNGGNSSPYQGTNSSFTVGQNETAAITLVRDTSSVTWYKNGTFGRSEANSYPTAASSVNTILIADGYTNNYLGKISFCALYNRALSAAEVNQNFQALRGRYGI